MVFKFVNSDSERISELRFGRLRNGDQSPNPLGFFAFSQTRREGAWPEIATSVSTEAIPPPAPKLAGRRVSWKFLKNFDTNLLLCTTKQASGISLDQAKRMRFVQHGVRFGDIRNSNHFKRRSFVTE